MLLLSDGRDFCEVIIRIYFPCSFFSRVDSENWFSSLARISFPFLFHPCHFSFSLANSFFSFSASGFHFVSNILSCSNNNNATDEQWREKRATNKRKNGKNIFLLLWFFTHCIPILLLMLATVVAVSFTLLHWDLRPQLMCDAFND